MWNYYVNRNAQANGDHEVHREDCQFLPALENRLFLGSFNNCRDAVQAARSYFVQVNGCYFCASACHTG